MEKQKKPRGGNTKRAPEGYYTAKQARERLGLASSTFIYYVQKGKIRRFTPPLKREGYYLKKEIDRLATEMALFLHTIEEETTIAEVRVARPEDTPGIVYVLTVMGWPAATDKQRMGWYTSNPFIDYVVLWQGEVMGYIFATPLRPEALRALMSGKGAWNLVPEDILPYRRGEQDIYIGIATRQDIPTHARFGFRLIAGFIDFLIGLAEQGIIIHRLYAVSNEPDGQRLCNALGFVREPAQPGDAYPRYMLDLKESDSQFARVYRESLPSL